MTETQARHQFVADNRLNLIQTSRCMECGLGEYASIHRVETQAEEAGREEPVWEGAEQRDCKSKGLSWTVI